MVTQLVPGIREKDIYSVEGCIRNTQFQHFLGIGAVHAHIRDAFSIQPAQQHAHARAVHFDAEVVVLRMCQSHGGKRLTIAEADLEMQRRSAPEERNEIEQRFARLDAVTRQ